ncbi:MAG TPA: hypothetical protein VFV66_15505 [Nonomuraea sp.]|nr:hypothetical protein [Nonomuraea sp.]
MRKILSVAVSAVLLAAIGVAQRLTPDADRMYAPIASTGGLREDVRTEPYSVRVDAVGIGRKLIIANAAGLRERQTRGLWVVVTLTATATKEQVRLGKVELQARDGTLFGATDRFTGFDTATLEAGIPRSGMVAFELPAASAPGAVLRITEARYGSVHRLNGALGPAVEVDLGITAAHAAAAAATVDAEQVTP